MPVNSFDAGVPFAQGACSLRVQSVVYGNAPKDIRRSLASIARAAEIGRSMGRLSSVEVAYGDSSADPILQSSDLTAYREEFPELSEISYTHFGANLGSAGGQNRLLDGAQTDFVFFINPDVRFSPTAFAELLRPFAEPGIGITEARQLPIEHPKFYDPRTGETGWATGACMMVPMAVAKALGGFDDASFFLYCDDVDFSWRVRLSGLKVIYQPSAGAFHDKRLTIEGGISPGMAELYYSAEAALLLAHKYNRMDLVRQTLGRFEASDLSYRKDAAASYRARQAVGRLPRPIEAGIVAEFVGENYARHRFAV